VTARGLREGLREGFDRQTHWVWLVDGSTAPEPSALERLLEAVANLGSLSPPVLLASKVVTPDGALDPGSLPTPRARELDFAVAACQQHLVALRVARRTSLLVHRRGFEACGLPRAGSLPGGDDLEWTARLLRHEPGVLVPRSVAIRRPRGKQPRVELAARLRLLRSDALARGEKPWFAFRLVEDAVRNLRRR
jgi:hypothetical protein